MGAAAQPSISGRPVGQNGGGGLPPLSKPWVVCLLLAIATFAIFWPVVGFDFINYDDPVYYGTNRHVWRGLGWSAIGWALKTTDHASWYPVTWLSYLLDATLFGKGPAGPHFTNLLLHVANTILVFVLLRRMTGAHWRSAFVAAVFALHPLHVESVAWISERKGLLSAFFGLLSLISYFRYAEIRRASGGHRPNESPEKSEKTQAIRDGSVQPIQLNPPGQPLPWYLTALVFFALSLLSKPALASLALAMLLLDYWPLQRLAPQNAAMDFKRWWPLLLEKVPFLLLGILSSIVTIFVHEGHRALTPLEEVSFPYRIETAFVSYARYLGKMFWPTDLALPYPDPGSWPLSLALGAAVIAFGLSIMALWYGRLHPYLPTGWFWFLALLLPVIGVIGWGAHTMADRFTYLPMIGLLVGLTWATWNLVQKTPWLRKVVVPAAALVILACALRTRNQLSFWKNSETLFRHSVAVTTDNIVAWDHLGIRLWFEGHDAEAEQCFREALRLNPNGPQVLYDLGNLLGSQGRWAEAATNFEAAVRSMPENSEAEEHLGLALANLGKIDEAIEHVRLAVTGNPESASPHRTLAKRLGIKGDLEGATAEYREALRLEPENAETWYALGIGLALHGKWDEATQAYRETLSLDPGNAEAEYNLGYALKVQGKTDEAVTHLRAALLLNRDLPLAHYNLSCVLADKGLRDEAITHLKEALRLKSDYREAQDKLRELGENSTNQEDVR